MATTSKKKQATTKSKVNYTYDSRKESASQYNARVAKERGDSSAQLNSMQRQTQKTFKERGLDVNKKNSGQAISATTIGTTSPVIPPRPTIQDQGDILGMNNASVLQQGLTLDGGQFVKDESASDIMNATNQANMNMGNVANSVLGYLKPEENRMVDAYEDTYGISARQAGREFRGAQQEVQQYTSQLNNITASRDASILALEDTGRGQTTGFIGGEQGRIQRQAAIAALPVQAQLAAAQGNLEIAKSHVDSLFSMKIKDIETEQAYKNTVANTWMSVANQQQSNLLNAAIADSNARAEAKKTAMNDAKQIAMQAIEYGQSSLAASVMKLDPISPTYQQDVMNAMAGLRKPVGGSVKRETAFDKDGNLVDMQTGEVISAPGGQTAGDAKQISESTAKLDSLLGYASQAKELSGASGASGISKMLGGLFVGDTKNKRLENLIDTMKVNLLTMNTDPTIKKFFGPQMSNRDTELMTSAGTTLNAERQSPSEMAAEIASYEGLIKRAKAWTYLGGGGTMAVTLIDPQTGVKQLTPVNYETLTQAVNDGVLIQF